MPRPDAIVNEAGETVKAGCAVLNDKRQILLARDVAYHFWSLPKGHIEADESPEQAAVRETLEETGWEVKIIRPLGELRYVSPVSHDPIVFKVYLAAPLKQTGDAEEESRWFNPGQLEGMLYPSVIEFLKQEKII